MNIALVGCGRIALYHLNALRSIGQKARLAALVDSDRKRAEAYGEQYGCKNIFTEIQEAAESLSIDASIICLPHHLLSQASMLFLEKGKHVLAEKPLGVDTGSLLKAVEEADKRGLVFQAGYVRRFMPSYHILKRTVEERKEKVLRHICVDFHNRNKIATPWWREKEKAGGFYVPIFGSHYLDQMLWLRRATPCSVYAAYQNLAPGTVEGETDGALTLSFCDKTSASLIFSTTVNNISMHQEIIFTEKHTFETGSNLLKIDGIPQELPACNPFLLQLQDFTDAVEQGRPPSVPAREALKILQLINLAGESAKLGMTVTVSRL
ncbi:MAG TPA: Gfo/Idh/MocA family oxidoreductase [bacterium]|nr:Gfo/Idh/MocA family oxidoreductase [bacterium]